MADEEQLRTLREGVEAWNRWRGEHPTAWVNLSAADLSATHLREANLSGAYLDEADLRAAALSGANLSGANLVGANLWTAKLNSANLSGANLRQANLSETILWVADLGRADLRFADLSGARPRGADFSEARVSWTVFNDVDLSDVKGLESVLHEGPSRIGIDTVYASRGQIPETFLRGCGVPDEFITYMRSLVGRAIEYYSCFISYSSKDQAFAERLHADLQAKGVRCWFAPEDVKIGDRFRQRIEEAIRVHDKLLLILSEHSVRSDWVASEVEAAFEKERRQPGQSILFSIRLDDAIMDADQAWAADIRRTRHIGDFTRWKEHDAYAATFDRLVRDLKAAKG